MLSSNSENCYNESLRQRVFALLDEYPWLTAKNICARYVKQFLGHKCLKSTEVYINIERSTFETANDNFTVKVAENPDEIKELLETGFEYVCQKDNLIFLRKRK